MPGLHSSSWFSENVSTWPAMSSDRLSQVQVLRMLEPWRKGQAISRCRSGRWLVSVVVERPARSSFSWGPHVTIPAHQPTWLVYHLSCPLPRPRTQITVSKCASDRITACAGCGSLLRVPSRLLQGRQLGFCHVSDETMANETFWCWWIWKEQTLNDDPGTHVFIPTGSQRNVVILDIPLPVFIDVFHESSKSFGESVSNTSKSTCQFKVMLILFCHFYL